MVGSIPDWTSNRPPCARQRRPGNGKQRAVNDPLPGASIDGESRSAGDGGCAPIPLPFILRRNHEYVATKESDKLVRVAHSAARPGGHGGHRRGAERRHGTRRGAEQPAGVAVGSDGSVYVAEAGTGGEQSITIGENTINSGTPAR